MDSTYNPADLTNGGIPVGHPALGIPIHPMSQHQTISPVQAFDPAGMGPFFVTPEAQKPSRARRKSSNGGEHVKHRRTRSGCFTCRQRRVKCDETHPICERCAKGNRECKYPEIAPAKTSGSKKRATATNTQQIREERETSSLDELDEEDEEDHETPGALSERSPTSSTTSSHPRHIPGGRTLTRRASWTTNPEKRGKNLQRPPIDRKPSYDPLALSAAVNVNDHLQYQPPTPTSPAGTLRHKPSLGVLNNPAFSHLSGEIKFFLSFQRTKVTCHHYFLKADHCNFFQTTLLEEALKNEALMYAVVAFASFRYSVQHRTGAFQTFLEYYNIALGKLRESLTQEPTLATLLTILQIASFEEFLGDWGNLVSHRDAAAKVILALFTPETLSKTSQHRMIYNWFARFDLFAAMMGGHSTMFGKEWSDANRKACEERMNANPLCIDAKIEHAIATLRENALRTALLTQKRTSNSVSLEEFTAEAEGNLQRLEEWEEEVTAKLADASVAVTVEPLAPTDANYSPFLPGICFRGERWPLNLIIVDCLGLKMVTQQQLCIANEEPYPLSQMEAARQVLSRVSAVKIDGDIATSGWLFPAQAALGLAVFWTESTPENKAWLIKTFHQMETEGYIYPASFRSRVAELWNDPSLRTSWAGASTARSGLSIRQLADESEEEMVTIDQARKDVREMRALFSGMQIVDGSLRSESSASPASSDSPNMGGANSIYRAIGDI